MKKDTKEGLQIAGMMIGMVTLIFALLYGMAVLVNLKEEPTYKHFTPIAEVNIPENIIGTLIMPSIIFMEDYECKGDVTRFHALELHTEEDIESLQFPVKFDVYMISKKTGAWRRYKAYYETIDDFPRYSIKLEDHGFECIENLYMLKYGE